jgi:tetratricopeptide (TPR) repeat protein
VRSGETPGGAAFSAAACAALGLVFAWQAGGAMGAGRAKAAAPLAAAATDGEAGGAVPAGAAAEALWQHRNLGKALYENPTTQAEAVEELRQALALAPDSARERLNYGLALLKAGRTAEGIAELEKVQRQDPTLPHTWFNLGIAWKRASEYDKALAQLRRMVELAPDEPVSHYNLGVLYKLTGKGELSLAEFETAARLAPQLAGPHFQLFNAYKVLGRGADAARELATFQEIKKRQAGAAVPEDLEWSFYSELYDPPADKMAAGWSDAAAALPSALVFEARELARGLDPATAGLLVLDVDGNGRAALLAWSAAGIVLWRPATSGGNRAGGKGQPAAGPVAGLEGVRGVVYVAAGDFNNDGLPDLCVLTERGARLYVNRGGGRFEESPARLPAGRWQRAVWLDYDHDYDLDLVLLGDTAALVRNDGAAGWSDHSGDFPFAAGRALDAAVLDTVADAQGVDLVVSYQDHPGVLYRDRLGGHYTAEPLPDLPAGARALAAYDFDGDGWTDLAAQTGRGAGGAGGHGARAVPGAPAAAGVGGGVVLLWNRDGRLSAGAGGGSGGLAPAAGGGGGAGGLAPAGGGGAAGGEPGYALAVADLGNRAAPDLVTGGGLYRWQVPAPGKAPQAGRFEPALPPPAGLAGPGGAASAVAAADFDRDGREDLAVVRPDGALVLLHNVSPAAGRWLEVALTGVRNPKLAEGARVEVKAGSVYQKKLYHGAPLLFGLRGRERADTVRITWPNGLIQNETRQAAAAAAGEVRAYKEAQRLSGSCPMVFAWNGSRFEFITDVLGVAPLGASSGDGQYFPVDHDEWVSIPGSALVPVTTGSPAAYRGAAPAPLSGVVGGGGGSGSGGGSGGVYEVRITEELREVTYLDRVRLLALDHPAAVEVFTNEKFKSPPFPEFRLFGVERRVRPLRAVDDRGRDQLPALLARDGVYAEGFRHTLSGVAETHALVLDFGPAAARGNRAVLFLTGWVDWADGSTFRAASQESAAGLMLPRLEVRDAAGRWQTAVADMGIPAGKPKTIAVDLTGKFLSASREVRIVTNLCVYWDEAFLGEDSGPPPARLTEVPLVTAELRFRGFSRPVIDPARRQPEEFDYGHWMASSSWNPTPGLYTRYGEVRPLLERVDDELVIMGSGDELRLRFAGGGLPPLPPGWRRDFLLDVDGWAKDADPNTAYAQSVEPLPFHAMSAYPYPASERFPDDAEHRRWREDYNRRPALRLLRPLAPPAPPAPPAIASPPAAAGEGQGSAGDMGSAGRRAETNPGKRKASAPQVSERRSTSAAAAGGTHGRRRSRRCRPGVPGDRRCGSSAAAGNGTGIW